MMPPHTLGHESLGQGEPDPLRRTGDHDDLVLQLHDADARGRAERVSQRCGRCSAPLAAACRPTGRAATRVSCGAVIARLR